jgi:hypothetical protein
MVMPEYKSVYFAPDGVWFERRKDCEAYEKIQEIRNFIMNETMPTTIAQKLCERYTMEERWDWRMKQDELKIQQENENGDE